MSFTSTYVVYIYVCLSLKNAHHRSQARTQHICVEFVCVAVVVVGVSVDVDAVTPGWSVGALASMSSLRRRVSQSGAYVMVCMRARVSPAEPVAVVSVSARLSRIEAQCTSVRVSV